VKRRLWIERDYKAFNRTVQGRKMIEIFRILSDNLATLKEIKSQTTFSKSEIRNLLILAEKNELISSYLLEDVRKSRGRPITLKDAEETGRRPRYYGLTYKSRLQMRTDPELAEKWKTVEKIQFKIEKPNILDSFNNLRYAIGKHPILSKLKRPWYFDGELQRTLLNPLLFETSLSDKQFDGLSNELVRLIKQNVKPEFIRNYRSTLQSSASRLEKTLSRHKLVIRKIETITVNELSKNT
jgi:hypothetical protein